MGLIIPGGGGGGGSAQTVADLYDVTLGANTGNGALWTPFPAIPQTYKHLRVELAAIRNAAQPGAADLIDIRVNGSSGANYAFDGGFVAANWNDTSAPVGKIIDTITGLIIIDIPNYASTTLRKSMHAMSVYCTDGGVTFRGYGTLCFQSLNAITSLGFGLIRGGNSIGAGSRATLYGLN